MRGVCSNVLMEIWGVITDDHDLKMHGIRCDDDCEHCFENDGIIDDSIEGMPEFKNEAITMMTADPIELMKLNAESPP